MLPAVMNRAPTMTLALTVSLRNISARPMVMTTLNLFIGATRATSPVCSALK